MGILRPTPPQAGVLTFGQSLNLSDSHFLSENADSDHRYSEIKPFKVGRISLWCLQAFVKFFFFSPISFPGSFPSFLIMTFPKLSLSKSKGKEGFAQRTESLLGEF